MSPVLLIGCGRMGGAMARQWRQTRRVLAFDPGKSLPDRVEPIEAGDLAGLPEPLTVVLAVKPQIFASLDETLAQLRGKDALHISIMAGLRLADLTAQLGPDSRVVRAMPNTPAAISKGITVAAAAPGISAQDRLTAQALLSETGDFAWVEDESMLDAVTALSGSGPAYFFRVTEALAKAGEAAGLPAPLAMQLARATFTGAASLAKNSDQPLEELRSEVTSPGGTTAAGLAELDRDSAIDTLFRRCVSAARDRSIELSS